MRIEELLTRFGLLWLDGSVVLLVAAVQAGPFLLAGGGLLGLFAVLRGSRDPRPAAQRETPAGFTLR